MAAPVVIRDPMAANSVMVTEFGQLVVAPISFSAPVQAQIDTSATAFNLLGPTQDQQIVLTDIIITANRNVGVNDATIDLYLADSPITTVFTADDAVLSLEIEKNGKLVLTGLNLITAQGKWINAKSSDTDIFITLMYYRVPVK